MPERSLSPIARARRWWWRHIRRHHGEICHGCGRPVARPIGGTYWFADNALWNRVEGGEGGLRCPACFTLDARRAGVHVAWRAGRVGEIELEPSGVSGEENEQ
mgnify:CR=1 FL=1